MTESRPDLVFDEVTRLIVRQEASLDNLRSRAGGMLGVAALVAALFGGRVTQAHHHGTWRTALEICALVLFGLTAAVVLDVERPRQFHFGHDPTPWLDMLTAGEVVDVTDFATNVGRQLNDQRKTNKAKIERLWHAYTWVCLLIGLQVLAWGAAAI
jgi:hypothetical protein